MKDLRDSWPFRYKLVLDYDGANFHGWQIQNNERTVQGILENVLSRIYQSDIVVTGCGRTDAGVHARNYVAHVDLPEPVQIDLGYKLNRMLQDDVAIRAIQPVDSDFHARYSAIYRQYRYCINSNKIAIGRQYSWYCPDLADFDLEAIEQAIEYIKNAREFLPFCKTGSDAKTMSCYIHQVRWNHKNAGQNVEFEIRANRFLRGMVRLIVGALVLVGRGQVHADDVREALREQARLSKSYSAPAHGLFLEKVAYRNSDTE